MKKLLSATLLIFISALSFSQITLTSTVSNVSCFGGSNGSASVTASGGTGAYTYTWLPTNTNFDVITGLAAGSYTVNVEDAVANTSSLMVTITQPAPVSTTLTATNPTCNGFCNGTGSVIFTGGAGTTTFLWQPGLQSGSNVNNLCSGSQTVTITSNGVCTTSLTFTLTEPPQLTAVCSATTSNCGKANGKTCALVAGGTPPLNFLWNNGVSTLCNNNVVAGAYTFTVTDANGCVANTSGLVNDVAGVIVSISSQTNISCFGGNNGKAIAQVFGGATPITYSWSASTSTTTIAANLFAGVCGVTAIDAAGCISTASVNITQPTQLVSNNSITPDCGFGCNGSIYTSISGGSQPYNYNWQNGATTPNQVNLCSGLYSFTLTDIMGCTITQTANVLALPSISISPTQTNATCNSLCNGAAAVSITGGTGPYSFYWSPLFVTTSSITSVCPGTYSLDVSDASGCYSGIIFTITTIGTIPNSTTTLTPYNETCFMSGDGAIDLSISGSNPGPFTYLWSNGATTQDINNLIYSSYWVTINDASSNCMTLNTYVLADGVNCGSISGNVFIDNNNDCIKNTGDNNYNNAQIIITPGNKLGYTNSIGNYTINDIPYGTYSVTAITTNPSLITTCVTTLTATLNSGTPHLNNKNYVRKYLPLTQPNLNVWANSNGIFPGFVCTVNYYLSNYNSFSANGIYKATLPSSFIPNITMASPATYTLSGDTIIWNFSNITNTNGTSFIVQFTTPVSTPLGSTFTSSIFAQPTVTDLNYTNNTHCYTRMVTGSYDPNDKTPNPLGVGATGDIAASVTDLTYLIRFQNTGNGPAVNIKVTDTLSPNVNINTFEMLGASHNYNIDILPGNVLRWKFNNIMLVDSGTNEPASHGYIQYRIKRTANNTPGTQIKNTAYIYFDFNEPVITNTAINTIETITSINTQSSQENGWNVYPNPSTGALYIVNSSMLKESSQVQILNAIGQTVLDEIMNSNYKNIDLSKLNNGVYFIKISSDKQNTVKRIVLSK